MGLISRVSSRTYRNQKMASVGTGYDSDIVLSPDGRIFQVEYAGKAVEHSTTVIGMLCNDGVVLAAERQVQSKLYEADSLSARRIYNIDTHIGCAVAGLLTDARSLIDIARNEATNYREQWQKPIPVDVLVKRVSNYMFQYTLNGYYRPFGCAIIVAGTNSDTGKSELWMADPSGVCWRYKAIAVGKTRQAAKTELEKVDLGAVSCAQGIKELTKVVHAVRDENQAHKQFMIDVSHVGPSTNGRHCFVSENQKTEAESWAQNELNSDSEDDDDDDEM